MHPEALAKPIQDLRDSRIHPIRLFRLHGIPELFHVFPAIFLDRLGSILNLLRRQRHLRRRIDYRLVHLLDRALAFRVEGTDRIDLVAPQLDPVRHLLRQRENVNDTAAHRKLP